MSVVNLYENPGCLITVKQKTPGEEALDKEVVALAHRLGVPPLAEGDVCGIAYHIAEDTRYSLAALAHAFLDRLDGVAK